MSLPWHSETSVSTPCLQPKVATTSVGPLSMETQKMRKFTLQLIVPMARNTTYSLCPFVVLYSILTQTQYTGAYYRFAVNHPGRAIFAISLLSPLYAAYENWEYADIEPTPDKLPELRRASDIFATFWLYNNPNPRSLKYYFSVFILNDETLEAIASVLKQRGTTEVPKWPGIKFSAQEPAGQILLGKSSFAVD
jgi:hypothetical protein